MVNKTCPHLGRRDDSSTIFNYPSVGNSCHHARPLTPPSEEHQFEYCLSGRYKECPVFQAPAAKRLPPSIQMADWIDPNTLQGSIFQRVSLWQLSLILFFGVVILVGIGMITILTGGGYIGNSALSDSTSTLIPTRIISSPTFSPITETEASPTPIDTPFSPLAPSPTATEAPSSTPTFAVTSTITLVPSTPTQVCTLPPGWVTYIVQAGDTLSKISMATGMTIAQLQQANCLGNSTQIFTGQRLFVPKLPEIPTATVVPATSPTPTLPIETLAPSQTPTQTNLPPTSTFTPLPPSSTNTSIPPTDPPTPSSTPFNTPTLIDEATQPSLTLTSTPGG